MKILDLRLEGFSVYKNPTSFTFEPGINILVGPNGCGKTSILEAIYLSLFATSFNKRYINVESSTGEITVNFLLGDTVYTLTRKFSNQGENSVKLRHGNQVVSGAKQVRAFIDDLLGFSGIHYPWYIRQNQLPNATDHILKLTNDILGHRIERLDKVSAMLDTIYPLPEGYETLASLYQMNQGLLQYLTTEIQNRIQLALTVYQKYPIFPENFPVPDPAQGIAENNIVATEWIIQHLRTYHNSLVEKLRGAEQAQRVWARFATSLATYRQQRRVYRDLFRKYQVILAQVRQYHPHCNTPADFEYFVQLQQRVHIYQSLLPTRAQLLEAFRRRPASLADREQERSIISHEVNRLSQLFSSLTGASDTTNCPYCLQPVTPQALQHLSQIYTTKTQQLADLDTYLGERAKVQQARRLLRQQIREHRQRLRAYADVKDLPAYPLEELLLLQQQFAKVVADLEQARQQLATLRAACVSCHPSPADVEILETLQQIPDLSYLHAIVQELEQALQGFGSFTNFVSQYRDAVIQHEDLTRKTARVEFEQGFRAHVYENVTAFRNRFRHLIYDFIKEDILPRVNELLSSVPHLGFVVSLERVDDEYVFLAETVHGTFSCQLLSVGQRSLLSLIFTLFLYKDSNIEGVILLDEPTAGLDAQNVGLIKQLLSNMGEGLSNKQCLICSHEYSMFPGGNIVSVG